MCLIKTIRAYMIEVYNIKDVFIVTAENKSQYSKD